MSLIDQINIIRYHNNRIQNCEEEYKKLGWKEQKSQHLRFEALIEGFRPDHSSVLDVGCGYADFKLFLDRQFTGVSYTGIDIVPGFAHEAAHRFANDRFASFIHGDFSTTPMTEVDYVFCCGALCYRNSDPEFPYKMIRKIFYTSRIGIAFCMLDSELFPEHPVLTGYSKKEVTKYCRSLTNKVTINDNYLLDDFTIKMWHR